MVSVTVFEVSELAEGGTERENEPRALLFQVVFTWKVSSPPP